MKKTSNGQVSIWFIVHAILITCIIFMLTKMFLSSERNITKKTTLAGNMIINNSNRDYDYITKKIESCISRKADKAINLIPMIPDNSDLIMKAANGYFATCITQLKIEASSQQELNDLQEVESKKLTLE
jgi:hypothetical protein